MKRSCPCCHFGYVGGPHDKGCCVPEAERLRATVAELRARMRLARRAMRESGAPYTLELADLLDLRRPLPRRKR